MAITEKTTNARAWRIHFWWECTLRQLLWKSVWTFIKKLKIDLPLDPAVYPKEYKLTYETPAYP
jgi:hypothetical protein